MNNNFKSRNPKLFFQLLSLSIASILILGITLFRSNKTVIFFSLYEELMPYLHRISHLGRLIETNNDEDRSSKKYISSLLKYFFSFSIIKGETKEAKALPILRIDLPYEEMSIIRKDRHESIKRGYLTNPKWADGTISYNGEVKRAKFRLKGDLGQHWLANKRFSLRIRTKKNKTDIGKPSILGMKTFSIHKLSAREYPYENIFQELLKKVGLHSIPHKVVKVFVNGNYWGLMDMQEHFSSELLEKNKMRDSLIFTFSNDSIFSYRKELKKPIPYQFYWLNNPRLFLKLTSNSLEKLDKTQKKQYHYVESILREKDYQDKLFSKRHLRDASDLLNIWGDFHPFFLTNVKFYLNPFTLKLEPLMADQGNFKTNKIGFKDGISISTGGFLKVASYENSGNSEYKKLIANELATYEPSYEPEKKLFPQNSSISVNSTRINLDKTETKTFEQPVLPNQPIYSDNIKCSKDKLSIPSKYPAIFAKYTKNEIQIIPLLCGELKILEAKICNFKLSLDSYIKPKNISIYEPNIIPITNEKLISKLGENSNCSKTKSYLSYSFNGTLKNIQIDPFEYQPLSINPLVNNSKPSFIKTIGKNKFLISKGTWNIKKPILIEGKLIINEGVNLKFSPNSYMIIKGNIEVNGSNKKPVVMTSLFKDSNWKGLYVFNETKEKQYSSLKSLRVSNTESTQIGILNLTGGITFYNTKIFIDDLEINNSMAEDALNIVNGDINISKMNINSSRSDGFDCDFCKGTIGNMNLEKIGGDGLDISGSQINATIYRANNVKDKVVSIGEESTANIYINEVKNSFLAAAIKDGSIVNLRLKNIQTNGPIAMSYIKKDFYDKQTITNITYDEKLLENIPNKFLADKKTLMKINNKKLKGTDINVKNLYEFGPMKKN